MRQRGDGLGVQVKCGEQGGHRDGLIDAYELLIDEIAVQLVHLRSLGGQCNRGHGADGFDWVFTRGRLGREHHGVSAVEHGIGHITHLGSGGHRGGNHALHHLRGGDGEFVAIPGALNHALLQRGYGGVAHLNGKVAASHHDAVAGVDDFIKRLRNDRLGALDLCDQFRFAASGIQNRASGLHIVRAFRERDGEVVAINLHRRFDVGHVFGGERGSGQPAAQTINAFVVGQLTAQLHDGENLVADDALNL